MIKIIKQYAISSLSAAFLMFCSPTSAGQMPTTVPIQRLSMESALQAAQTAIESCREKGFQVAVTVVDRAGHPQIELRDVLAMDLTLSISRKKAYTAMVFGKRTSDLMNTEVSHALQNEQTVLFAGGGIPIRVAGSILGGIGVGGAATAKIDEICALNGVKAIEEKLEMSE